MAPRTAKAKKAADVTEAPKKGRGKAKQVDVEPDIEDQDVDEKIAAPVEKKKRGKKVASDSGNGVDDVKEESAPLAKRGRKKVEESLEEDIESIEDNSGDDGSPYVEDDGSVDTNGDEPLKASSSRGRKKQPKKETAKAEPKGRGRKAKPEPEPEDEDDDPKEIIEEKPKGRGRGRKAAPKAEEKVDDVDDPEELPKAKPGRGRKKAPTKIVKEKTPESDDVEEIEDEDEPIEEVKKKEPKGKKGKKEAKEDSVEKDDDAEEVPAAKKRKVNKKEKGDYKDEDEDEEIPESKPKGRGRGQKKAEKVETTTPDDDDTESTNKRRRKPADDKVPLEDKKKAPLKNKAATDYQSIDFTNESKNAQGKEWNFKISSWNVGGIRSWLSKGGLDYVTYEKPDILCLQEVKCAEEKLPEELTSLAGYHGYWCSGDKDGHAGVNVYTTQLAINVQKGLNNEELDEEGRIITAEYEQFYLICVYVPNSGRKLVTLPKRLQWNEEFRKHVKELDKKKPVIICGDMNVSHKEIDLANPKTNKKNAGFTEEERAGMTELLGDGFVDTFRHLYPEKTSAYTFWTYMMNCRAKNVGWRLDYFIVSERLLPAVCDNVIRDKIFGSDHCPISLFLHLPGADKPKESL